MAFNRKITTNSLKNTEQILVWFSCFIVLGMTFYSVNRGVGMSDESWFLLHKDSSTIKFAISNWHEYTKDVFYSIIADRLFVITSYILCAILFSIGFKKLFQKTSIWTILPLAISGMFMFRFPLYVSYYITYNVIIITSGVAFFMMSIALRGNRTLSALCSVLSGMLLSQLFFIMITTVILIPIIIICLFFFDRYEKRKHLLILFNIAGIALGLLLYFIFFDSLISFVLKTISAMNFLSYRGSEHGISTIIKWLYDTFKYFSYEIIFPAIALIAFFKNHSSKKILATVLAIYFFYVVFVSFASERVMQTTNPTLLYIFSLAAVYHYYSNRDYSKSLWGVLFMIIPLAGNIGSDVDFKFRSVVFVMPLLLFTFQFIKEKQSLFLTICFYLFVIISSLRYSFIFPCTKNVFGQTISSQDMSYCVPGEQNNIYLDHKRLSVIYEINKHIPVGSNVVFNMPELSGYIYLCNLKPVALYYRYDNKGFKYLIEKKIIQMNFAELYIFEAPWAPFKKTDVIYNYYNKIDTLKMTFKDFKIYRLSSPKFDSTTFSSKNNKEIL